VTVVAVTGCSGYIGSRLSKFMEDDDRISRIIGVDLKPPAYASRKLDFHRMDVRDRGMVELFCREGAERVVHLAFVVNPMHDTGLMHDIDVGGCINVLSAASECGAVHLVVASSTSAFGALPDNPEWLSEEHPPRLQPNYTYASDKYEVETLLREFKSGHPGIKLAVVRPAIVFGPNVDNYLSRFILRLPFLPAIGGARPEMQFVHEDDIARVFYRIIEEETDGYFHAVGEGTINSGEIARLAGKRVLDLPAWMIYPAVDLSWRLHLPRTEGPSGMLDFIRYRWTASDGATRARLGLGPNRSSEEVVRIMLESHGLAIKG
jgi:UDP-glucose 4-epimerase